MRTAIDIFIAVGCVLLVAYLLFESDEAAIKACQETHSAAVCQRAIAP